MLAKPGIRSYDAAMRIEPRYLGKYELQERLGRGGMGEVWKAFDPQLRRYVAIKVLNADLREEPDFVARFTHEAQLVASLHHPNIVQIHDFQFTDTSDGNSSMAYMVMDYVEGTTLADYIYSTSRKGQYPSGQTQHDAQSNGGTHPHGFWYSQIAGKCHAGCHSRLAGHTALSFAGAGSRAAER